MGAYDEVVTKVRPFYFVGYKFRRVQYGTHQIQSKVANLCTSFKILSRGVGVYSKPL